MQGYYEGHSVIGTYKIKHNSVTVCGHVKKSSVKKAFAELKTNMLSVEQHICVNSSWDRRGYPGSDLELLQLY